VVESLQRFRATKVERGGKSIMKVTMKMRELGTSGIRASIVGLGTYAIGGWVWGGTDEKKAIEAIQASIDMGVNLIDTAPIYGFGAAEKIVAKAIKGRRDKVVLATKVGLRWDLEKGDFLTHANDKGTCGSPSKYRINRYLGPESIRYEIEMSLKRLGTDHIDLYQTHWQDSTTPIPVTMETLKALQKEGKIRAIGVSNVNVEQLKCYGGVASAQEKFNLLDRGIVKSGLLDACVASHTSILTYFTMEQGLLTGAMSPDRVFKDGDSRGANPLFTADSIRKINATIAEFKPFAEKYNATLAQIVIALTSLQRGITHVLVGARDAMQAKENAIGGYLEIEAEDLRAMNVIAEKIKALAPQGPSKPY
jgi:aryl-alcohol dehydrogenase-like predicted oxidoreductase